MPDLFIYGRDDVELKELLGLLPATAPEKQTVALLYGPGSCSLARLQGQELHGPNGGLNLADFFEARLFSQDYELRWLDNPGRGRAALLVEDQALGRGMQGFTLRKTIQSLQELERTYLLWGEYVGTSPAPGWVELKEYNVGGLLAPLSQADMQGKKRVFLQAREYLAVGDEYGNVEVAAQRLLGLQGGEEA